MVVSKNSLQWSSILQCEFADGAAKLGDLSLYRMNLAQRGFCVLQWGSSHSI
jgi:hypothetical protein